MSQEVLKSKNQEAQTTDYSSFIRFVKLRIPCSNFQIENTTQEVVSVVGGQAGRPGI
jgi:hypothetical protein